MTLESGAFWARIKIVLPGKIVGRVMKVRSVAHGKYEYQRQGGGNSSVDVK